MENITLLIPLVLSSLIGLASYLRGLRETYTKTGTNVLVGGVRTFFLLSLGGLLSGALIQHGYMLVALLLSIGSVALVLIFYAVTSNNHENYSLADEISAILIHVLSLCWAISVLPQTLLIAAFVGIIFILEQKEALLSLRERMNAKEMSQIVIFLATALVILPFLPQHTFSLAELGVDPTYFGINQTSLITLVHTELLNPYRLWFIVVLVSGIDVVGYLLKKAFSGKTSILLSSMIGGFISSTSTTVKLAAKSKHEADYQSLVSGAILANVISFFQLLILIAPISLVFLKATFAMVLAMSGVGLLTFSILSIVQTNIKQKAKKAEIGAKDVTVKSENAEPKESSDAHMFHLDQAIKFALLLTFVKVAANVALVFLGSSGFILTSMIAALSGGDAVVITLAELVQKGTITGSLPLIVFALTNAVNLVSKTIYSASVGSKQFAKMFGFSATGMIAVAIIIALLTK